MKSQISLQDLVKLAKKHLRLHCIGVLTGWFGVAVTAFSTSTKLSYIEPG